MPEVGNADLLPITELLRERALEGLRLRSAELARLSGEIAETDRLRQEARNAAGDFDAGRMLGIDTLWYDWTLQRRADLMSRCALARAHQAEALARARAAFSRHEAAEAVFRADRLAKTKRGRAAEQATLDALIVLRGFAAGPGSEG